LAKEREILKSGLSCLGIEPDTRIVAAFDLYTKELKKWNKVHNITAITDEDEIVSKHFLDSLLYLKAISVDKPALCDVGSGGGFPGLPIAIVRPDFNVTLLEPARKKAAFLKQMRRLLGLKNVEIIACRAEELEESEFDVVVTRATFSIEDMLAKAGHLIKKGGVLIMSKGPKYEEEIKQLPALYHAEVTPVSLAQADATRNLIIIRRS
jgi:16S rRNA (guanine527-N7)-methyltransferase